MLLLTVGPAQVLEDLGFQVEQMEENQEATGQEAAGSLLPAAIFHTAAGTVFGQVSPGIRWGGRSVISFAVSEHPAILLGIFRACASG